MTDKFITRTTSYDNAKYYLEIFNVFLCSGTEFQRIIRSKNGRGLSMEISEVKAQKSETVDSSFLFPNILMIRQLQVTNCFSILVSLHGADDGKIQRMTGGREEFNIVFLRWRLNFAFAFLHWPQQLRCPSL